MNIKSNTIGVRIKLRDASEAAMKLSQCDSRWYATIKRATQTAVLMAVGSGITLMSGCDQSHQPPQTSEHAQTAPGPAPSVSVALTAAPSATNTPARPISYSRDIRPILSDRCFTCHGLDAGSRKGDLRLDVPEDGEDYSGAYAVIVPGDPEASDLVQRIHHTNPKRVMPPASFNVPLTDAEKALLEAWIKVGAPYEKHWAFVSPKPPVLPAVQDQQWVRNPIDQFVLARLEAEAIPPSPQADPSMLARRVALDLTGLPPNPDDVAALRDAKDPDAAYLAYVDKLLASPRFGERMASVWLDAARYADTNGYLHDNRRTMWPWRDWVIHAYNNNMPYDQFLRDQVAGDLVPNATIDQLIATGFNRNHGITTEGGAIDEEYRVEYAADRTNTLGTAALALTVECARCHDHKYDPISQEDYFSLFAYFNSIAGEDPVADNNFGPAQAPTVAVPDAGVSVMVVREQDPPLPTYVLDRGQYDAPIKSRPVTRRPPLALGQLPADTPANRLGLAQWLIDPSNPLTARVEVNRIWQTLFGIGLVKTSEDFGMQGEWPSHPELLDWLACEFMSSGWDRKALIRTIVTSATYRQTSHVRPELKSSDPENRLLARMSRLRLPAEMVRDQVLAVSNLLVNQVGGEGVRPYQPAGLWEEGANAGSNTKSFNLSEGEGLYRRSIYTFWKRTAPPPQMVLFDAPDRNACSVRRASTNTPLQALLLMNDTQHLEAARILASRVWAGAEDDDARLSLLFQICLARDARPDEQRVLRAGLTHYRELYQADPSRAQTLLSIGQSAPPVPIPAEEWATWTMMATTMLNLDEMINRP